MEVKCQFHAPTALPPYPRSGESNRTVVTEVNPKSASHLNYEQRVQTTNSSALLAVTKPDHVATNRPDAGQGSAITSSPVGADAVRSCCVTTNMGWSPLDMVQRHSPYRNFE